ncbi:HuvX protein [Helicobacter sp. 13S00401-1]|uniref:heme utilization cystosolic carrier protein HutX n=1 Tax=Helicobacter sp. 13S00401-1 TaxID=1905758 RepID=UPI000BA4F442|nr:heme utilization cystosolic carrier protein HutX [Helicobacter sp. 13S00401-1]PAF50369.1 HuvX protein [Helicobacter sp. 13S00401-1]
MESLKDRVDELFKDKKMSVVQAAAKLKVPEYEILSLRGGEEFKEVSGSKLDEVLKDLESWGELIFCKNTPDFIMEFKVKVGKVANDNGYYNFSCKSGFLGGHLKEDSVKKIGFVCTTFMGMLGYSVHFYNEKHETIFKFYITRDENMLLNQTQIKKFEALKKRL